MWGISGTGAFIAPISSRHRPRNSGRSFVITGAGRSTSCSWWSGESKRLTVGLAGSRISVVSRPSFVAIDLPASAFHGRSSHSPLCRPPISFSDAEFRPVLERSLIFYECWDRCIRAEHLDALMAAPSILSWTPRRHVSRSVPRKERRGRPELPVNRRCVGFDSSPRGEQPASRYSLLPSPDWDPGFRAWVLLKCMGRVRC
ncbi:hypothetical protein VNO77_18698 [Canavalia gladiata]|uniref:Uncharacterized protein n=1 Tax=Canavalia gladiata TaxID=3824 RepID=A0AAN9LLA9_CANGL